MARTHVILVNWNGHRDTIECLEALMRLDCDDFDVIVVDNGSREGSIAAIRDWASAPPSPPDNAVWRELPPERRVEPTLRVVAREEAAAPDPACRVTIVDTGRNLGFAAACNMGMRIAARDPQADFFWLLNNDTVPRADALTQLLLHARLHPAQAIVGATLLYYDEPTSVQGLGGWMWPSRARAGHIGLGRGIDDLPSPSEVEAKLVYVMGASMFMRRELIEAIGGMSEEYFLYFEEPDLARRLPPGMGQGVCLGAIVYHKEGGSIGTDSIGRPSDTSLYYYTLNTLRYYWKHERRWLPVAMARVGWNATLHASARDAAAVRVIARACADALVGRGRRGIYGSAEFRGRGG